MTDEGQSMYQLAKDLFPICRSLTGDGVRETLHCIQKELPALNVFEVPVGHMHSIGLSRMNGTSRTGI